MKTALAKRDADDYDTEKNGRNKHTMDLPSPLRETTLGRMRDAYRNPRLEDPDRHYLTAEHIEALRDDSEIVTWDEYADPRTIPGVGTLRRIGIETAQGYTYDTLVGLPETPECDIPVIGTTAWTTSLRGHNEHLVRNLMRSGNYVMYVGAEGSYIPDAPTVPRSPISLANSAAAVLNFTHHMALELKQSGHDVHRSWRFAVGESRGGMVAEGLDALSHAFDQDLLFADEVAPCLPDKLKSVSDIYRFCEQLAKEPREMYKLIGSLTLARLRYYPHTIDIRRECLRQQAIIGGALFSGEAGALARRRPGGTLKHLTVFNNDFASMRDVWEDIYRDDPYVRITPLPGAHMTIANMTTLRYVIARNKAAQRCANEGLDFTQPNVIDTSHDLATSQYPISAEVMNSLAKPA